MLVLVMFVRIEVEIRKFCSQQYFASFFALVRRDPFLSDTSLLEFGLEPFLVQIFADDYTQAFSLLVFLPLVQRMDAKVAANAVEHMLFVASVHGKESFGPVDVVSFSGHNIIKEFVDSFLCHFAIKLEMEAADSSVVYVVEIEASVLQELLVDRESVFDAEAF